MAPLLTFMSGFLLSQLVVPEGATDDEKITLARVAIAHFKRNGKGESVFHSWLRGFFGIHRYKPWNKLFVDAMARLTEPGAGDKKELYVQVSTLLYQDIIAGFTELLNGNILEPTSKAVDTGWGAPNPAGCKTELTAQMKCVVSIAAAVAMEHLSNSEGAGNPGSEWCALSRFFVLLQEDEKKAHLLNDSCVLEVAWLIWKNASVQKALAKVALMPDMNPADQDGRLSHLAKSRIEGRFPPLPAKIHPNRRPKDELTRPDRDASPVSGLTERDSRGPDRSWSHSPSPGTEELQGDFLSVIMDTPVTRIEQMFDGKSNTNMDTSNPTSWLPNGTNQDDPPEVDLAGWTTESFSLQTMSLL